MRLPIPLLGLLLAFLAGAAPALADCPLDLGRGTGWVVFSDHYMIAFRPDLVVHAAVLKASWGRVSSGILRAVSGCLAGFAAIEMWGYVLNYEHTGLVLGQGQFGIDVTTSPSYPSSAIAAVDLLYETLDLGFLSDRRIHLLAVAGVLAGVGVAAWAWRQVVG